MSVRAIALALAVVLPSVALAQTAKPRPPTTDYQAKARHFDFDDDIVEATGVNPDGFPVDGKVQIKFSSLVKPRTTFVPEILKSALDH